MLVMCAMVSYCRIRPVLMFYPILVTYAMRVASVVHNIFSLGVIVSYFIVCHPTLPRVEPIRRVSGCVLRRLTSRVEEESDETGEKAKKTPRHEEDDDDDHGQKKHTKSQLEVKMISFKTFCFIAFTNSSLSVSNAAICFLPNTNGLSFRVNLLSESLIVTHCGMNLVL
ncbi:hypothetical protein LSAT2_004695 [Lamellibrachia satsuma]|nr:hypothetical protein LSAT2_004695 [Lamellibrachia satsuma]